MIEKDVPEIVVVMRGPRGGLIFESETVAISHGRTQVEFLAKFIRSDVVSDMVYDQHMTYANHRPLATTGR